MKMSNKENEKLTFVGVKAVEDASLFDFDKEGLAKITVNAVTSKTCHVTLKNGMRALVEYINIDKAMYGDVIYVNKNGVVVKEKLSKKREAKVNKTSTPSKCKTILGLIK